MVLFRYRLLKKKAAVTAADKINPRLQRRNNLGGEQRQKKGHPGAANHVETRHIRLPLSLYAAGIQ